MNAAETLSPSTRVKLSSDGVSSRVAKLKKRIIPEKFPICAERACLLVQALSQAEGDPPILRGARATANYLDHKTIFIEDDELIVGNPASKPMGMEAFAPTWPAEEVAELREQGFDISEEDEARLRVLDEYWIGKHRLLPEKQAEFYDDERMWPFIQSGILLPPWKQKGVGRGYGGAGNGWGYGSKRTLAVVDYAKMIDGGANKMIREAEEELRNLRYTDPEATHKAEFLHAVIMVLQSFVGLANRYADLAERMAAQESNPVRAKELQRIAETCRHVPANPARTFYEAMQSFWFTWMMVTNGTESGGRFDQYMYPYYKADKGAGRLTDDEALELIECLRLKVMTFNFIGSGKMQRDKWAGMARWNNWVIGGLTPDGKDATNELTYLTLEAARRVQTPHYTITLRVHDGTPDDLMVSALEVVKTGIGMPAFVSDKSYIDYFESQGVPIEDARNYALGGCLEGNVPGKSGIANAAFGMFIAPLVFEITMHNGIEPRTGRQLGPRTGEFESFKTYDDFLNAYKEQLKYFMGMAAEEHNILVHAGQRMEQDAFYSALFHDAVKVGKPVLERPLPFENGSCLNVVGMITVADSLAAVKKLIYEEKKFSPAELHEALAANWAGERNRAIRELCLAAPKYGNGDNYVDSIAGDLYQFWAETAATFVNVFGGTFKASGISITSHGPGGALTGATPDGRAAGENLSDGTMSPAQGRDTHGPTAVIRSALAINQTPFQSTLLNMKFHPSALKATADLEKLGSLIRTYFAHGGKHVQFNVVGKDTLMDAQKHPENYRDLIVRVAGYSAYFVQLTKAIQDDIIRRSELELTA